MPENEITLLLLSDTVNFFVKINEPAWQDGKKVWGKSGSHTLKSVAWNLCGPQNTFKLPRSLKIQYLSRNFRS